MLLCRAGGPEKGSVHMDCFGSKLQVAAALPTSSHSDGLPEKLLRSTTWVRRGGGGGRDALGSLPPLGPRPAHQLSGDPTGAAPSPGLLRAPVRRRCGHSAHYQPSFKGGLITGASRLPAPALPWFLAAVLRAGVRRCRHPRDRGAVKGPQSRGPSCPLACVVAARPPQTSRNSRSP